jgi:two-component system copper resistance phosphate regulon response regulator CusR
MRILLVEDDPKVSNFIVRGLVAEGYAVDTAINGETGLEMIEAFQYDLVVLDLMLPGMTGNEVLKTIRRRNTEVPLLILTARDGVNDKVENLEAGADDYLTKPFAFVELLARIRALLRRGGAGPGTVLKVGNLEMDRVSRRVRRGRQNIDLTGKEFALLEYLMTNAGRVLSRTMIVEHVWDQSFDGLTNIVDVYVRYLRAKIDDPFETKLIRTVRGAGYVIEEAQKTAEVGP